MQNETKAKCATNSRLNRDRPVTECLALEARVLLNADFNHDGRTDLVWHNKSTEEVVIWEIENDQVESSVSLPNVPAQWDIVGFGDFNRDGDDDILWRNAETGENVAWLMDSESIESTLSLPAVPVDSGWEAQAVGDFTNDARADIVWRNYLTGENVVWVLDDDESVDRSDSIPSLPDLAWRIVGAADFNDDLHTDILLRNDDTGQNVIWLMDGRDLTGDHSLPTVTGREWHVGAVGNFTGNIEDDILWRRDTDGAMVVWRMGETTVEGDSTLPSVADGDWTIGGGDSRVAGDDWNRDGRDDALWLDSQTGRGLLWYMNGGTITDDNSISNLGQQVRGLVAVEDFDGQRGVDFLQRNEDTGAVTVTLRVAGSSNFLEARRGEISTIDLPAVSDAAWQIAGVADFNGDESPDILWRNTGTGENVVWLLNRGHFAGSLSLPAADAAWEIQAVRSNDAADTADVHWRNTSTGQNVVWTMQNDQIISIRELFAVEDQNWRMGAAFDPDGDGDTDVLWQNTSTGECVIWFYNGTTFAGAQNGLENPTAESRVVS